MAINNSDGPVNLCVIGDVRVDGGTVSVTNGSDGGRVNVYQRGYEFEITNDGSVSAPNDYAPMLWFYGDDSVDVLAKDSRLVGVISMPSGRNGNGEVN